MKTNYIQLPPTWHQRSQTFWLGLPGAFWTVSTMCGASEVERMDCNNIGRVVSRFSWSGGMCIFKSHVYMKEACCVHPVLRSHLSSSASCKLFLHIKHKRSAKKQTWRHIQICFVMPSLKLCIVCLFFFPCASTVT